MREIHVSTIRDTVAELAVAACCRLPDVMYGAIQSSMEREASPAGKDVLRQLLLNADIAASESTPICQDTGLAVVFAEVGQDVHVVGGSFEGAVNEGVAKGYTEGYLRKSSVAEPLFERKNTGDNTPAVIHTEIVAGDKIKITFMPKGFGSENMSRLYMLKPAQGVEGIINAIVETVKLAGSRPCPPVYVGVGIGGTFDTCAFLAKKALTRDIGTSNPRGDIAEIERIALEKINALDIGCQGFHGSTTALGVACEWAPTHIAGLPVAVNIQCHCVRCERAEL